MLWGRNIHACKTKLTFAWKRKFITREVGRKILLCEPKEWYEMNNRLACKKSSQGQKGKLRFVVTQNNFGVLMFALEAWRGRIGYLATLITLFQHFSSWLVGWESEALLHARSAQPRGSSVLAATGSPRNILPGIRKIVSLDFSSIHFLLEPPRGPPRHC